MAGVGNRRNRSLRTDDALTRQCVEILTQLGMPRLASQVVVDWNPRMRTTAGRAFYTDGRIELNPKLLIVAEDQVLPTLLHELAHLVAHGRAGRRKIKAHGIEWQQACSDLGIPGESVTHSLPLPGRTMQRRWSYQCPHCEKTIFRVRKMKRPSACYDCCRTYGQGHYLKRFRLIERRISDPQ